MKPHSSTIHHGGSTLPAPVSAVVVEDARNRSVSADPQHLSIPEPFQSIPAQELLKDNCGKCGWIRKEGGSIKTWHDRYVILHKGCLYYYCKPEAVTTAGKFSLSGYRLSPAPEKSSKYQWTFKLAHIQPEKRTYYFAAYSEREMNEWMENITKEMEEYCGNVKPSRQETVEYGDGAEYCYPEVEPKFDPEEFAALFGKPSPSLPRKPATKPLYCPPPVMEPIDMPKKSPNPSRSKHPFQKESEWPKGCSVSNIRAIRPPDPASASRPLKPFLGCTPVLPPNPNQAPFVPSRAGKPPAAVPPASPQSKPKPKPKPLPRPPPLEHTSKPILNYGSAEGHDEDEISEGYLDIVPDTTPEDVEKGKKSTFSRGHPDGNSFRRHAGEVGLPSSAATALDMDKAEVTRLLENKLGVYILRKSENAQSKRALAVWTGDRVRHYLIFYEEKKGYTLDPTEGTNFETLEDLLSYYYKNCLPKCEIKLIKPFKR